MFLPTRPRTSPLPFRFNLGFKLERKKIALDELAIDCAGKVPA